MAKNFTINNVLLQYNFLERVNPVSNKFSFNCLVPQDHPQIQEIMDACMGEWNKVSEGAAETAAQSLGFSWVMPNDAQKIHPDLMASGLLDPAKQYLKIVGTQPADTTTPIQVFDSAATEITQRSILGEGTLANVSLSSFGYKASGQKGVKIYGQWIQIVNLVENPHANIGGHGPAAIETGGYVADASLTQPVAPAAAAPAAAPVYAAPGAPAAAASAPAYAAPTQAAAPVAPAAPAAPQYAAPQAAPVAPAAAPVYAAPQAPQAPVAPTAAPVYAAPQAPQAPAVPGAPAMPQP